MPPHSDLLAWLQVAVAALVVVVIVGYGSFIAVKMRQQGGSWVATAVVCVVALFLGLGLAGMTLTVFKTFITAPTPVDPADTGPGS